jgi:hypothetical protein
MSSSYHIKLVGKPETGRAECKRMDNTRMGLEEAQQQGMSCDHFVENTDNWLADVRAAKECWEFLIT